MVGEGKESKGAFRETDYVRRTCEAATPGPWSEDDCNLFSEPLRKQRDAVIFRRLEGEDVPHPDEGWADSGDPMGYLATTGQGLPNGEPDARAIALLGSTWREALAVIEALGHVLGFRSDPTVLDEALRRLDDYNAAVRAHREASDGE